jgi:hypothetical protein
MGFYTGGWTAGSMIRRRAGRARVWATYSAPFHIQGGKATSKVLHFQLH